jgi:hypothetical protein
MKRQWFVIALALAILMAPNLSAGTWTGWITDEHCGAKGAKAEHKGCALSCAGRGAALVFYNSADEKIYKLDSQDLAKEHLGAEVELTGELEGDTVQVKSITEKTK